jgi:hypothetical protein
VRITHQHLLAVRIDANDQNLLRMGALL